MPGTGGTCSICMRGAPRSDADIGGMLGDCENAYWNEGALGNVSKTHSPGCHLGVKNKTLTEA